MNPVPPPDSFQISAAIGWLELGNAREAMAELAGLSPEYDDHPDVLDLRWWIATELKDWDQALGYANRQVARIPDRVSGWIHQAYALRRVKQGGLLKAREILLAARVKFPKDDTIPFNLACYEAQLGNLDAAWEWLHKAMEAANSVEHVKKRALADEDLKPLWDRIQQLE